MAQRPSGRKMTANELVLQKLKMTFDRNENVITDRNGMNVWVMFAALSSYSDLLEEHFPYPLSGRKPTHRIRVVLRTNDSQTGTNPYVDGSDFFLEVDEHQQTADFVWEDDSFGEAPLFHGGDVASAVRWVKELGEPYVWLNYEQSSKAMKIKHKNFKGLLTKLFFEETDEAPTSDALNQALNQFDAIATYTGGVHPVELRVGEHNASFYYDLSRSGKNSVVEVGANGWQLTSSSPVYFLGTPNKKLPLPNSLPIARYNLTIGAIALSDDHVHILFSLINNDSTPPTCLTCNQQNQPYPTTDSP